MSRRKHTWQGIVAGLSMLAFGTVLIVCAQPIYSYVKEELQQIPRSETVINYPFNIYENQSKSVQVQLSIGQTLNISATSNDLFSFALSNFTETDPLIQPDQPDQTYLSVDNTSSINTSWSPTSRTAEPGNYYLVFLTDNTSSEQPVQIHANVTKTWTELQITQVPAADRRPIIDPGFSYLGAAIVTLGAVALLVIRYFERKST